MPIRKTSLALAAFAGAVAFFIAPHPAGLAKGVSRSATMGSNAQHRLAMCAPDPDLKTSMVMEQIVRFGKEAATVTPRNMAAAARVMGVEVPLCVDVKTGLLKQPEAGQKSWTSGAVFWYFLGSKDKGALMKMLHVSYLPDADLTHDWKDCPTTWLRTPYSLRDLMSQCLILEVTKKKVDQDDEAEQLGYGCVLSDKNEKGYCKIEWAKIEVESAVMFTGEKCGDNGGDGSTTKALVLATTPGQLDKIVV